MKATNENKTDLVSRFSVRTESGPQPSWGKRLRAAMCVSHRPIQPQCLSDLQHNSHNITTISLYTLLIPVMRIVREPPIILLSCILRLSIINSLVTRVIVNCGGRLVVGQGLVCQTKTGPPTEGVMIILLCHA